MSKWRRVMAVGCTHGEFIHPNFRKQVLKFKEAYKPEIRFDLGDLVDTTPYRNGARGTPDERRDPRSDYSAAISWLDDYEPTHIAWGNHCWRIVEAMDHTNGIIADAAKSTWESLNAKAKELKAKTVPYDFERGWFELGGHFWGHGYWFNEMAVRDHAEYLGGPTVMAHIHTPQTVEGRTRHWTPSFCVGLGADKDKLTYARRRRATSRWGHGLVFGEINDTEGRLWLASAKNGEQLRFPFPI